VSNVDHILSLIDNTTTNTTTTTTTATSVAAAATTTTTLLLLYAGFTSMCVSHIRSPIDNARRKIEHIYTGPLDTELVESMFECSPEVRSSGSSLGTFWPD